MIRNFPKTSSETSRDMTLNEFLQHIELSRADSETQNPSNSSKGYEILKKSLAAMHLGDQELAKDFEDLKKKRSLHVPTTDKVRSTNSPRYSRQIENVFINKEIFEEAHLRMLFEHQKLEKAFEDKKRRSERRKRSLQVPLTDNVRSSNSPSYFGPIENGFSEDNQINRENLVEAQKRTLYGHQKLAEDFENKKRRLKRKERALLRTDAPRYFESFENDFHGADSSHRKIPELSSLDDVRGHSSGGRETSCFSSNNNGYLGNEISQINCSNNENPITDIASNSDVDVLNNEVGNGVVIGKECIYIENEVDNDAVNDEVCFLIENKVDMKLVNEVEISTTYYGRDLLDSYDMNK